MATQKASNPSAVLRQAAGQFGKILRTNVRLEKTLEKKELTIAKLREAIKAAKAKKKVGGRGPAAKKTTRGAAKKVARKSTRASKVEEVEDDEEAPAKTAKKVKVKVKVAAKKVAKKTGTKPTMKKVVKKVAAKKVVKKAGAKKDKSFMLDLA